MSKCRNNNYNRGGRYAAKSNTGTWIKVIAVLLALLAIAYVIASLVLGAWNPLKWNETRLARTNGSTQGDGNGGGNQSGTDTAADGKLIYQNNDFGNPR